MEEHKYAFFEEPCRFDDLWETKKVADALAMPIAGGEQEFSLRRFRWTILNRGLDVVQPDLHYFGGYIRSTRVALMSKAAGLPCTPHMSGWGMGYLNAPPLHVVHSECWSPHGVQGIQQRALQLCHFIVEVRGWHHPSADRSRIWCRH